MKCSLGIFAYNEEKNIGKLLETVLTQELNQVQIEEIFVFADGCTDKTISIAQDFAKKDARIKILTEKKRMGKSMAVNIFLNLAKNDILVMESGDTIPGKNTVENLVRPFFNKNVGMVGSRPVPLDNPKTFMGFATHLLWELHHQISLVNPKMGEMVAFRKVFKKIPLTAVDEAYIEGLIREKGYQIIYLPQAIVYNKGPENIRDFLRQRRRIFCGHFQLRKEIGHRVSTLDIARTCSLILKDFKFNFQYLFFTPAVIFLEALSRFLGWWDYKTGKSHLIWEIAESTKNLEDRK